MSMAVCREPGRVASRERARAHPAAPRWMARREPSVTASMIRAIQSRYSKSRRAGSLSVIDDDGTPLTWRM